MQELPTGWSVGDRVDVRGEAWSVRRAQRFAHCTVLALDGLGPANLAERRTVIAPFDRPSRLAAVRVRRRRRDAVLRQALAALGEARPARGLWTAARASIDLLPWQLAPALAVLDGATRLLLADEVGLGKTIEAGLVLAELAARGLVDRAVLLTPAGLRHMWASELAARFRIDAAVVDQSWLSASQSSLPPGANPWMTAPIAIASIDLVKRADVHAALDEVPIDLLVVDEAHHLTPGSDRSAVVSALARRTPWVVLVTATPHSGDDAAFAHLCAMGSAGPGEPPMRVFRRTRATAGVRPDRRVHLLRVQMSAAERALHQDIGAYTRALWAARRSDDGALALVASLLARRAASSAYAAERTLARRRALLATPEAPGIPHAVPLPWEERDDDNDEAGDAALGVRGLADGHAEAAWLTRLIGAARRAQTSSTKVMRLLRLLHATREPLIVFTEFRDTLLWLEGVLDGGTAAVSVHGGLDPRDRRSAIERFERGAARVLLATDTAGEGLSLHARCRTVVMLELPWNPVRVEQRIGRVDRIGQRRRVHAMQLVHRGTVEDSVLAALDARRRRAHAGLGPWEHPPHERWIRRAVFEGDAPIRLADRIVPREPPSRSEAELARLHASRRAASIAMARGTTAIGWALPTVGTACDTAVAFVEVIVCSPHGRLIERVVVPLALALAPPVSRYTAYRALRVLAEGGDATRAAVDHVRGQLHDARSEPGAAAWRRVEAIVSALGHAGTLVQPGLFHTRAEVERQQHDDARRRIVAHLSRLSALLAPAPAEIRASLIALVPGRWWRRP
jgi:superfamily II DNA or RNA helicase